MFGSRAQHGLSIFFIDGILPDTTNHTPFLNMLTSTPYLNQQSNYAYGQERGKNNDLFKK